MLQKLIITITTVALVLAMTLIPVASAQAQQVCTVWHSVQRGETLYRISRQHGISIAGIQSLNGLGTSTRIYAGQNLCVQAYTQTPATTYTVQRGDTLARIARYYGVNLWELARVNGILNLNRIYSGQVLTIPAR